MDGRIVVAQSQTGASQGSNTGGADSNSNSAPVQIIKIIKPPAGQTEVFHASYNGTVKIDFTAIANERITLYNDHATQTLHIIFSDGAQAIIEPFFDSTGSILSNLLIEVSPNQDLTGAEFASQFPITEDQSVLPAAGPGEPGTPGTPASGADFQSPTVTPLGVVPPLDLLPPETLPPIEFGNIEAGVTEEQPVSSPTSPPSQLEGTVQGVVEEEQITRETQYSLLQGNEDPNDASAPASTSAEDGLDRDTSSPSDYTNTTNEYHSDATTSLANLFTGATFSIDTTLDGSPVLDSTGTQVTTGGGTHSLVYGNTTATDIYGGYYDSTSAFIPVFHLHVNSDGSHDFYLLGPIDQGNMSVDDGTNPPGIFEETLYIDLTDLVLVNGSIHIAGDNIFTMGVIDDTPIALSQPDGVHEIVVEDALSTTTGDPGDLSTGNLDAGQTTSDDEASGIAGSLSALFSAGADVPLTITLSTDTSALPQLYSGGVALTYSVTVNDNGTPSDPSDDISTLTAKAGSDTIFTLIVNADGSWSFDLDGQLDHTPADGDSGYDLITSADGSTSVSAIDFSPLLVGTDADGDSIVGSANSSFAIAVQNDVPTLVSSATTTIDVQEDALGNATSNSDNNSDSDLSTGNLDNVNQTDSATFTSAALQGLVNTGADEPVTFALVSLADDTTAVVDTNGTQITSKGDNVYYTQVSASLIYGYADVNGNGSYDAAGDRIVFELTDNGDGSFTLNLDDQIDHDNGDATGTGDTAVLALDLTGAFTAEDYDHDPLTLPAGTLVANVENDVPVAYTPDAQTTTDIAGSVITGNLNTSVGSDEPGTDKITSFTYSGTTVSTNGSDSGLDSGGQNILLTGFDTDTLTGFVDVTGGTAGVYDPGVDSVIFTMALDPTTDTYQFSLDETVDNGSGITFTDYNGVSGGNSTFFAIDVPSSSNDLLATAYDTVNDTVNSNANNFGVDGANAVNAGETLRFEFVTWDAGFPPPNPISVSDIEGVYDSMTDVNAVSFGLDNLKSGSTAQLEISLYHETDPLIFYENGLAGYTTDTEEPSTQVDVSKIVIVSGSNTYIFANDGSSQTVAGYTVDLTTDTASITGLHQGDVVQVYGASSFNDLTIEDTSTDDNATDGSSFKVSSPSLLQTATGDPIDASFGTTQTDYDGDSASGTIDLTLDPSAGANTLTGGPGDDVLIGGEGDDTLTGNAGSDKFVLQGNGNGHDSLTDFLSGTDEVVVDVSSQNLTIDTATGILAGQFESTTSTSGGTENDAGSWGGTANSFFYNETSHELWYSAAGDGSDKVELAQISTGVQATDIHTY